MCTGRPESASSWHLRVKRFPLPTPRVHLPVLPSPPASSLFRSESTCPSVYLFIYFFDSSEHWWTFGGRRGRRGSKRGRGPLALPGQEISHNNNYRSAVNLFFVPIPGRCPLALPLRRAFQQRKTSRHKADRFSRLIHLSWKLTNIVFLISPRHN